MGFGNLLTEKAGGLLGSRRHSQINRAEVVKKEGARAWQRSEMAFQDKNKEKLRAAET